MNKNKNVYDPEEMERRNKRICRLAQEAAKRGRKLDAAQEKRRIKRQQKLK